MAGKDLLSIVEVNPGDVRRLVINAVDMKSGNWTFRRAGMLGGLEIPPASY